MVKRLFYLLLVSATGCASGFDFDMNFDFDQPRVVSVSPAHNRTLVPTDSVITVDFSKAMDTVKTNNEFSLSGDSGAVEGVFAWENGDTRLVFTPREALSSSDRFTVRVTTGAEDAEGNDLKDEFISVFFISGESGSPYVVSYTPVANSIGNPKNTQVVLTFSEPVDLNSIYSGISVSPAVQGMFTWNAGTTDSTVITFTPLYGFDFGVTYSVNISASILDVSGNSLREPVTFNFTVGDDFTGPELTVWQDTLPVLNFSEAFVTHGAEKDRRIVLSFNETVITDNLKSAITVSPSAGFYVSHETVAGSTVAYINFTERLVSEEVYTLRINSSITDLQKNPLVKNYRFVFVTDGANSISPAVVTIGDLVPPLPPPALQHWIMNDIQTLALDLVHPLLYSDIIIDFNHEIDPLSLSISAETAAGTGGSPSIVNIDWPDGLPAPAVKFMRLKFGLYNVEAGNIYKIVVKGGKNGLRDINGNYMKEDFVQMVQF